MKRFLLLLLLGALPLFAQGSKFYLSQTRADLGDAVFLILETEGGAQVRLIEKEWTGQGIKAVYWGTEENTTIVNFKVYRKKLIKYRLTVSAPGRFSVPEIEVEVDGQKVESGMMVLEISPRSSSTNKSSGFFSNRYFFSEETDGPEDGDLKVLFRTNKDQVWVGEPVLGFFTLYYRNAIRPYIDRDFSSSIEFPYFRSEALSGINLLIPEQVIYEGLEFETAVYNKETFILTPLKKGEYSLGSTIFHLEGRQQSFFHMRSIKTIPSKIFVKDLPSPSPLEFKGAVGNFKIGLEEYPKAGFLGEPFQFKLTISGNGNLSSIKDPLLSVCDLPCHPEITFLQTRQQRDFRELGPGEFGFYLNHSYHYSVLPKKEGVWKPDDLKFTFFNPSSGRYESVSLRFPGLEIGPLKPKQEITTEDSGGKSGSFLLVSILLSFAFIGASTFVVLAMRKRHQKNVVLKRLDLWIGSKRGFVLKHSVMTKGLPEEEATLLAGWKSDTVPLIETYKSLGPSSRETLIRISYWLSDKLKEEESE
ncbi:BatD family protein [Leptospira neocaledonica]|uniref:Aerotolerance regulator BatD n=1 Tax=Leptospira neocaledonica TaxID=2023192 RepID=A0A2M9ZWN8_9LEPT|nr:BatD family protein [Leptospira neocaledonica]PJZ76474.1 aerotolerance regulator BatD [Leptospira neocaledonica]